MKQPLRTPQGFNCPNCTTDELPVMLEQSHNAVSDKYGIEASARLVCPLCGYWAVAHTEMAWRSLLEGAAWTQEDMGCH